MGSVVIPGHISGRPYTFNISGDQPSETELGRIRQILDREETAFRSQAEQQFGPLELDEQPGTAIGRGLDRGIPSIQRSLAAGAGALGFEGVDEYLTSAATQRELDMLRENPALLEGSDFRDVRGLGSGLTYVGELLGEQLPIIGGTVVGGGIGALAGAPLVGTALATLGVSGPILFGSNIQRQEGQVAAGELPEVDVSKAALAALGQTALEAASNLLLVGRLARPGTTISRRAIEGVLTNAPAEALTEIGQQVIERAQAGLDVDSEEAYQEYLTAGVAGGTLGGLFGAAGAIVPPRTPAAPGATPPADGPAPATPPRTPEEPMDETFETEVTDADLAAVGEPFEFPDPAEPITTATLDALGIPKQANIYKQVEAERLSGRALEEALDRYSAMVAELPNLRRVATRISEYLLRRAAVDPRQPSLALSGQPDAAGSGGAGAGLSDIAPKISTPTGATAPAPDGVDVPAGGARPTNAPEETPPAALDGQDILADTAKNETPSSDILPTDRMTAAPGPAPQPAPAPNFKAMQREVNRLRRVAKDRFGSVTRPVSESLKRAGIQIDPTGRAAQELRALGVTPRTFPGLFRRGGYKELDNIPVDDIPQLRDELVRTAEDGWYFDPADLIEAIAGEARRDPRKSADMYEADTLEAEIDRMQRELDRTEADDTPVDSDDEFGAQFDRIQREIALELEQNRAKADDGSADGVPDDDIPFYPLDPEPDTDTTPPPSVAPRDDYNPSAMPGSALPGPLKIPEPMDLPQRGTGRVTTAEERIAAAQRGAPIVSAIQTAAVEVEAELNAAAEQKLAAWFADNMSAPLRKFYEKLPDLSFGPDVTNAADKEVVFRLLTRKFTEREKRISNPEWAAHEYFRKHPNLSAALEVIAYDSKLAGYAQYKAPEGDLETQFVEEGDIAYLTHTGTKWAKSAMGWVSANMSRDSVQLMERRRREYDKSRIKKATQRAEQQIKFDRALEEQVKNMRPVGDVVSDIDSDMASDFGLPEEDIDNLYDDFISFSKISADIKPLHPSAVAAIRSNNLAAALDIVSATSSVPAMRQLAAKLKPYVAGIRIGTLPTADMQLLSDTFSDGSEARGVYLHATLEATFDRLGVSPELRGWVNDNANSIFLDEVSGLETEVLLHEVIHGVIRAVLRNENHPLTKRMGVLLEEARAALPHRVNELENIDELVTYGMTNPEFIQELAGVRTKVGEQNVSLWDKFKNIVGNLMRAILRRSPKPVRSAKDALDEVFDLLLAPAPRYVGTGDVASASFSRSGSKSLLNRMKQNTRIPTPAMGKAAANLISRANIDDRSIKGLFLDLSVPLLYLTDYASKYFPSARRVYDLVSEHAGYKRRLVDWTNDTVEPIAAYFKQHGQAVVDIINKIRYEATENEYQVNPLKPESEYNQYEFTQVDYNPDGTEAKRTRRQFPTEKARDATMIRLNAGTPKNRRRAIASVNPIPERIAKHRELRRLMKTLPEGGEKIIAMLFGLPEVYRAELQKAFTARLEAMLPGQRAVHERIFREVFDKLYADGLIDPYQALTRRGDYKLSYQAKDPQTGELKLFKHAFQTNSQRADAIRRLESIATAESALPAGQRQANISNITPYQSVTDLYSGGMQPPTAVLTSILNKLQEKNQLGDPALEQRVLELIFETAPETSFLQSFRKREGVPGYLGDNTPLDERLSIGDTLDVIKTNGYRLATKVADIRYQTEFTKVRESLAEEYGQLDARLERAKTDPTKRADILADAAMYLDKLNSATRAPFQPTARWSQVLTSLGYTMALGGNVSTAALTFFQLPIFIGPLLMGKYGGATAMQAIGRATRILAGSGKEPAGGRYRTVERIGSDGKIERVRKRVGSYDYSLANLDADANPEVAYLIPLRDAANTAGALTRSMNQELVDASTASGFVEKMAAISGLMQHHAERYVRETTMIADYLAAAYTRMPGVKNQMSFKQFVRAAEEGRITIPADIAADAAANAVRTGDYANGSIYAAARTKLSQTDVGRVVFLFKQFPLSMMNLLVHTARRSFGDNPADKRVARLQLATMMGSLSLLSGAAGIPMYHTVSMLYDTLWPRDEDDEDFETLLRTGFLGEFGTKGLVNYLTGMNLSDRIGLSGVFYRPPLNSAELPWYGSLVEGYGGPVVGLGTRWFSRAPFFFSEGEYGRMLEAALPTSMANIIKALRFGTEGAQTLRDDAIIDSFSPYEVAGQFFGFMPARYEQQLSINRAQQDITKRVNDQIQSLLRQLYLARRHGDTDTFQEVMQEIRDFNARVPPSARITRDTIRRSLDSHRRTTREMQAGISLNPRLERQLKELASDYGPVSWMDQR